MVSIQNIGAEYEIYKMAVYWWVPNMVDDVLGYPFYGVRISTDDRHDQTMLLLSMCEEYLHGEYKE